jgi:hypothetical protein
MEEESKLIKLMANFPACDLREAYFQRWKIIFSQAIESEQELTALRSWKAKARPFLESSLERLTSCLLERTDEDNIRHDGIRESYKSKIATLTELLKEGE